jgi:hypothetical protein
MKLRHPFEWLAEKMQTRVFIVMVPAALLAMAIEQITGAPLRTSVAPSGIISFEFAGTLANAQAMVQSWGALGQVYAGLNLGFDFVFILTYVIAIGLGCVIVARAGFLPAVGIVLAWAMFAAGLLDGIENYNLIQILLGAGQELNAVLALWCAIPKFAMVGLGLAYFIIGGVAKLLARR